MNPIEDALCRGPSHLRQWLANRSKPGMVECGGVNIVEADDGDVGWHAQFKILECAYATDRRHVVKGDNCSKARPGGQQMLHHRVAQLRRVDVALELDDEFWIDHKAHLAGYFNETPPTIVGI